MALPILFAVPVVKRHNGIELCLAFMICEGPGKAENWLYNSFSEKKGHLNNGSECCLLCRGCVSIPQWGCYSPEQPIMALRVGSHGSGEVLISRWPPGGASVSCTVLQQCLGFLRCVGLTYRQAEGKNVTNCTR